MADIVECTVVRLLAPGKLAFQSEDVLFDPDENKILIETIFSAISPGTEVSAFEGLPHLRPNISYPRKLGYCNLARIISVGGGIPTSFVGDIVLTHTSHQSHALVDERDILINFGKTNLNKYLSLAYLYVIAGASISDSVDNNVGVVGLGLLGLMSVELLLEKNISRVIAVSDHKSSIATALRMGKVEVFSRQNILSDEIRFADGIVEKLILNSNKWADWKIGLCLTKKFGEIAVTGFPGRGENAPEFNVLDPKYFYNKQLTIRSVGQIKGDEETRLSNLRVNIASIVSSIMSNRLDPQKYVIDTIFCRELESAYEFFRKEGRKPGTFILKW